MSKPSAVSKVVASLEAERAELLARAAVIEQVVSKLLVSSQTAKPCTTSLEKPWTHRPHTVKQGDGAA